MHTMSNDRNSKLLRTFPIMTLALLCGQHCVLRAEVVTVENARLGLKFDLSEHGITLSSIRNKSKGVEHLAGPSPLFELSAEGKVLQSNTGLAVDTVSR